jgi:hypothetical protein
LPDASVLVLQGFAFVLILASEALRGRLGELLMRPVPGALPEPPLVAPTPSPSTTPSGMAHQEAA